MDVYQAAIGSGNQPCGRTLTRIEQAHYSSIVDSRLYAVDSQDASHIAISALPEALDEADSFLKLHVTDGREDKDTSIGCVLVVRNDDTLGVSRSSSLKDVDKEKVSAPDVIRGVALRTYEDEGRAAYMLVGSCNYPCVSATAPWCLSPCLPFGSIGLLPRCRTGDIRGPPLRDIPSSCRSFCPSLQRVPRNPDITVPCTAVPFHCYPAAAVQHVRQGQPLLSTPPEAAEHPHGQGAAAEPSPAVRLLRRQRQRARLAQRGRVHQHGQGLQ